MSSCQDAHVFFINVGMNMKFCQEKPDIRDTMQYWHVK